MKLIADYYLTHLLTPSRPAWPNIHFPYNTLINSGCDYGDMVLGGDFAQPDMAGELCVGTGNTF